MKPLSCSDSGQRRMINRLTDMSLLEFKFRFKFKFKVIINIIYSIYMMRYHLSVRSENYHMGGQKWI